MIPNSAITRWAVEHPWSTPEQVEQDLLLSQAICEISSDDYLGDELVFRGGTAFHKLFLPQAWRYSEDLDYVRKSATGIRDITGALTRLGERLGYEVRTRIGQHPKLYWRTVSQSGMLLRLKIEINTYERSPSLPHIRMPFSVNSEWFSGTSNILTFQPEELVATKIRALYQRKKGRDLFDFWLAMTELELEPQSIVDAFTPYRPTNYSVANARRNLIEKLDDREFTTDIAPLVRQGELGYDVHVAGALFDERILSRIDTGR